MKHVNRALKKEPIYSALISSSEPAMGLENNYCKKDVTLRNKAL